MLVMQENARLQKNMPAVPSGPSQSPEQTNALIQAVHPYSAALPLQFVHLYYLSVNAVARVRSM